MSAEQYYVYILRCADHSLYVGMTNDLKRRVERHNAGIGAKYTRSRLPVTIVYSEPSASLGSAHSRERQLKNLDHQQKLSLINTLT